MLKVSHLLATSSNMVSVFAPIPETRVRETWTSESICMALSHSAVDLYPTTASFKSGLDQVVDVVPISV